ncbi:hypothetical protein KFK14_06290 [Sphingobium phenoxybenzoativorans]|uniref:Uncharacterized protein n=1 Tax=Sphingobium phenoxybenzoativorans TaxID=1592790 RepID=A0A975Q310_9SPHN|nr:hypothetical protein [Sphingobium phenoxybenzoativorans]QUT07032.1 hypothetical protein KFK14_06290 [Sphingobium phenoxybenzoativorans]
MTSDNVVRLPGQDAPESPASPAARGDGMAADNHALALRMHRFSLDRDAQFQSDALRNPAWDILLSLYVAQMEKLDAPFATLCVANRLSSDMGAAAVKALHALSLVAWREGEPNSPVALTPRGAAQMNQFLQRVALSA